MDLLTGEFYHPQSMARYFFRRDQTPPNPFDARLLTGRHEEAIADMRRKLSSSEVLVIEVCSDEIFRCNELYLQGNPNYRTNVPCAEVWKSGYYVKYEPDVPVEVYESDASETSSSLNQIARTVLQVGKAVMFLSHLTPSAGANVQRPRTKEQMKQFCEAFEHSRVQFCNQTHLVVDRFGFRRLENGSTDIFHLPWEALEHQAAEVAALAQCLKREAPGPKLPTLAL